MNIRLLFRAPRAWLRDDLLTRLLRNVAYLFSANVLGTLIHLASLSLIARALGPEGVGVLVLAEAYIRMVDLVVRPESWYAVIKYGANLLEANRAEDFKRLVKFGTLVDLTGCAIATTVAVFVASFAGNLFGWDHETSLIAAIYSFVTLSGFNSTPTGVLRLFNLFAALASAMVILALVRLGMVAIGYALEADLWIFLAIFMAARVMENLAPVIMGWRELWRHGYGDLWKVSSRGVLSQNPNLWRFVWSANISLSFRASTQYLDTLFVGGVLDPAAAGLYHVAKRIGLAVLKIGGPIQQSIYPELAKLWARRESLRFRRLVFGLNAAAGLIACLVLAFVTVEGEFIVTWVLGDDFIKATLLIILHMTAATVFLFGICLRPALLSVGYDRQILAIALTSSIVFFVWMLVSVPLIGVAGASLAHVVHNLLWLVLSMLLLLRAVPKAAGSAAKPLLSDSAQ